MHRAVIEYDRTVSYVEADLLLLNIARARYHRPVHFTAVSSVAATFDFRTSAGITAGFGHVVDPSERPVNLGREIGSDTIKGLSWPLWNRLSRV
jgi:hypothetical protein